ncbi:MAG: phosphatase domain-containing protein, partial [Pseudomonadota bacterium]
MMARLLGGVKKFVHGLRYGEALEPDETVVLFPQSASYIGGNRWRVPLHAWVVELEQGSVSRRLGQHSVLGALDLLDVIDNQPLTTEFRQRLNWFMADREMNKRLQINIGKQTFTSPRSPPNGHIKFTVEYHTDQVAGSVLNYGVEGHPPGQLQLVGNRGLSVISDIDDTIKISNVTDKKQLVKGFFFDDYHVVEGMPELYRRLQTQFGACFHYVSASPWQLYPTLAPLLQNHYPFGSLAQRHFYVADRSFVQFFMSSKAYKINAITDIIERFPDRQYLLIGDSGERDPQVYAEVANRYAQQVRAILIRRVDNDFSVSLFSGKNALVSNPWNVRPGVAEQTLRISLSPQ